MEPSTELVLNAYSSTNYLLDIASLDDEHPIYSSNKGVWRQITELYTGGSLLESVKENYLPQRVGEPNDIYQVRIDKFTYNNLLSKGINTLVNQLSTGELNVSETNSDFWTDFREDVDVSGTPEKEFTNNIFREILLYGRVFVHADKTTSDIIPRNLLEEQQLGLRPYLTTYSAPQVCDWDEDKGRLKYVKVKQEIRHRETPFSPVVTKVIWTYITDEIIAKYVTHLSTDGYGNFDNFVNARGEVLEEYDRSKLIEPEIIVHGYGECPVKMLALTSETWISNLVIHKLKEAVQLENFIFDALSIGCHLQRVFAPYRDPSAEDGAYIQPCDDDIQVGNATIIKAAKYEIVEMQGSAVRVAAERLEAIQQEVLVVLTMKTIRFNQDNYVASGNSKRLDYVDQQAALVQYGSYIREFYQDLLKLVAKANGLTTYPYVHGYTSFELDTISELILLGQGIRTIENYMPDVAKRAFSRRFSHVILDTNDPELLEQLESELADMDFEVPVVSNIKENRSADPNQDTKIIRSDQRPTGNIPGESIR